MVVGETREQAPAGVLRVRADLVAAAVVVVVLMLAAGSYGWHRDELYFVSAGNRPAWGYPDQPPLVPLLAAALDRLGGGSLVVLRLLPAAAAAGVVLLAGELAVAMGGDRRARGRAAILVALTPIVPTLGHLLSTATVDVVIWLVVLLAVTRRLTGGSPRWWLVAGLAAGVGMQAKQTVALLAIGLLAGMVASERTRLREPMLWAGAAIAAVVAVPTLLWQADNGWPQAEMAASLRAEHGGVGGAVETVALLALTLNPVLLPRIVRGTRWLRSGGAHGRLRALGTAVPVTLAVSLLSGGQFYYAAPVLLLALAAAAVARPDDRDGSVVVAGAVALLLLPLALPTLPASVADRLGLGEVNETLAEQRGWDEVVAATVAAWETIPLDRRTSAVVVTANYGEASAIERWGPGAGIPADRVASGHNGWAWWGPPDEALGRDLVLVGIGPQWGGAICADYTVVTEIEIDVLPGEEDGRPVATCRRSQPWSQVWPALRHLD